MINEISIFLLKLTYIYLHLLSFEKVSILPELFVLDAPVELIEPELFNPEFIYLLF